MSEENKTEVLEKDGLDFTLKRLNTQHFWLLVSMIRKGGKDAILQMQQLDVKEKAEQALREQVAEEKGEEVQPISETEKKQLELERGMIIFDIAMEHAETDLQKLFADLVGMSLEQYRAARFDLTFDIIEQLVEKEDLAGFFKRAANFAQKFRGDKATA